MLTNYFSTDPLENLLQRPGVIAVLPFNMPCEISQPGVICNGLSNLEEQTSYEVWQDNQPVEFGQNGSCQWSRNQDILVTAMWLSDKDCANIENATAMAYTKLLKLAVEKGYPHPFRCWNYLPNINRGSGDQELYKRFCSGRLNAFKHLQIPSGLFPAASALGHHREGAVIYLFAAKVPSQHHHNSLQVDPCKYPREYGPSSPSFSRASSLIINDKPLLFISGTASITGHKTVAEGDAERQIQTTSYNIQHLLKTTAPANTKLRTMKVYIRYQHDYKAVKTYLEKTFRDVPMVLTQADICRKDLLAEIECFCS